MRWATLLVLAGCIDDSLVVCGDGRACPVGTTCATLVANGQVDCAKPDELSRCAGATEFAACGTDDACYASSAGLLCLPSGCGNGLVDPQLGEVCDDGNTAVGDGCAFDC